MLSKYTNLFFPVCSLAVSILIFVLFFCKKKLENDETKIYGKLVSLGLAESSLYTFICLIAHFWLREDTIKYFVLLNKSLYIIYILWFTTLFYYLINLYKVKSKELIHKTLAVIDLILIGLISFLDVEIYYDATTGMSNSSGAASNILFFGASLYVFAMAICTLITYKKSINKSKYIPFFVLFGMMIITLIVRWVDPLFSIYTNVLSFVLLVMYFTIENPDIKMVDELVKNRKIIERTSEEKSIFLFKMSQELKEPVKNISDEIKIYKNDNPSKKEIDTIIGNIDGNNNKIKYMINDVIGISPNDNRNLRILENTYNIYSLVSEVEIRTKKLLKKDINLNFSCDSNIPTELYGDSIKLKQVLTSIINNSLNNTTEGYIHIDISSITKYDICRLVISIKDSGKGIDLMTLNEILDSDIEVSNAEYTQLDKLDIDLKIISKIIKSLNGTIYISSEVGKGTEVIITLDQYIKENNKNNIIENYIRTRTNNRKALIVDDDEKELRIIRKKLEKLGYEVSSSLYAEDSIERIKQGEIFELILIDDEMNLMNGLPLLKKIKELGNNSKKMILLNQDKQFIGHHYIKEGFNDYIDKSKLLEELEKKCK